TADGPEIGAHSVIPGHVRHSRGDVGHRQIGGGLVRHTHGHHRSAFSLSLYRRPWMDRPAVYYLTIPRLCNLSTGRGRPAVRGGCGRSAGARCAPPRRRRAAGRVARSARLASAAAPAPRAAAAVPPTTPSRAAYPG